MQEEIFGPVLPILKFSSTEEAISIIQEHPTPLALYVFSNDYSFKASFDSIQAGAISFNDCLVSIHHYS